jgi:SWI/SNF-related matrix-associated actin-dependent regulator of chromatin subfamily A3
MPTSKRTRIVLDLTADEEEPGTKVARVSETENSRVPASQDEYRASTQDDEDGINEIIDITDEYGDAPSQVGRIDGKVVGLRYYDGFATQGEAVMILREPSNAFDRNAIRVNNVQGTQIGHLPRGLAAQLAPYIDSRSLLVEGVLAGEKGVYDCPISLTLWTSGDPTTRAALEARMKADKLPLVKKPIGPASKKGAKPASSHTVRQPAGLTNALPNNGSQQVIPELNGPSLENLFDNSQRFRPRDIEELVEQWGTPEDKLADMPMAKQPSAIQAKLLPYQLQVSALA